MKPHKQTERTYRRRITVFNSHIAFILTCGTKKRNIKIFEIIQKLYADTKNKRARLPTRKKTAYKNLKRKC